MKSTPASPRRRSGTEKKKKTFGGLFGPKGSRKAKDSASNTWHLGRGGSKKGSVKFRRDSKEPPVHIRRRSSSVGDASRLLPEENLKLEEGMRKLKAAQQQYERMKDMSERAAKGYLKRFSRRLENGVSRIPENGLPADLALPANASLGPRSPKMNDRRRLSMAYQQHYLSPLSPTRSEAQLNMSTGHQEDFLNKFLESKSPRKDSGSEERQRSETWAPTRVRAETGASEAEEDEVVVMAEDDSSDEEEEPSEATPVLPRRRSSTMAPRVLLDPRLDEEDSDTFESSVDVDEEELRVVVSPVPVVKLEDDEVKKRITLEKELGKGAFSLVFRGKINVSNVAVAIKIVDMTRLTQRQRNELESERDILSAIEHDNVIKLVDTYMTESSLYLLLELVAGGDLFEKIVEKGCFNERTGKDIMRQICGAVAYLHERGIVHRDLKPENILADVVNRKYVIKLADFGIAAKLDHKRLKSTCGSPGYVAPEVIRGEEYGKPVDMFAIGAIAYVLLAGFPPFFADDLQTVMERNLKVEYAFAPPVYWETRSEESKDFIARLLLQEPKARMTAVTACEHTWLQARKRRKQGTL